MHTDFAPSTDVPFRGREEDERACRVAFPGLVHNERLVSNDPRDVEAFFEGAAAGPDLQAHNRAVLEDLLQAVVVPRAYRTALAGWTSARKMKGAANFGIILVLRSI